MAADTSAVYLSAALRERLIDGRPLRPPDRRDLQGSLAFIDISGFSMLATELTTAHGHSEGAELLQAYVNAYLEKLIAAVLMAGGDIIKFAGDAFIALWRCASQAEAVEQSCRCCLSLIAKYDRHEIKLQQGSAVLRLHAGIAAGSVSELVLGTPTSEGGHGLEVLYSGSVVERMGVATNEAVAGELALSTCASKLLLDLDSTESAIPATVVRRLVSATMVTPTVAPSDLESNQDGPVASPTLPIITNWLEFLPAVLRAQLPASSAARDGGGVVARALILSEHRSLSIVALRVLGLGRGPCDVDDSRAAQSAVLEVQAAAAKFGGAVCRLTTDDKGTRFLIACGVPGFRAETEASAHSLYAWRALQIAQVSARALEDIGLGSCCGIATGQAFCGECGSALRAEYTVFGWRVNLCFRLMSLAAQAGKALMCDEATRQAILQTRPQQPFGGATQVALKGFTDPVTCFEPGRTTSISSVEMSAGIGDSTRELFGRDAEMSALEDALRRLEGANGNGGLVVLKGETGVGKSALLHGFTALARATNLVHVAYQSMDSAPLQASYPFGAFMGLLPQLLSQETLASLAHHFSQLSDSYMDHAVTARNRTPSPIGSPAVRASTETSEQDINADGSASSSLRLSGVASSPAGSSVGSSGRSSPHESFHRRWRSSSTLAPRVIEVVASDSATSSPRESSPKGGLMARLRSRFSNSGSRHSNSTVGGGSDSPFLSFKPFSSVDRRSSKESSSSARSAEDSDDSSGEAPSALTGSFYKTSQQQHSSPVSDSDVAIQTPSSPIKPKALRGMKQLSVAIPRPSSPLGRGSPIRSRAPFALPPPLALPHGEQNIESGTESVAEAAASRMRPGSLLGKSMLSRSSFTKGPKTSRDDLRDGSNRTAASTPNRGKHQLSRAELEFLSDPKVRLDLPLLSAILPVLKLPTNARTDAYSPAERADATQRLLVRLLSTQLAGQKCHCIVIDGAQWLHSTTHSLLAELLRLSPTRLLVVLATRSDHVGFDRAQTEGLAMLLDAAPDGQRLELDVLPLSAEDEEKLLRCELRAETVSPTFSKALRSRSHGNPFLTRELARDMLTKGHASVAAGCAQLSHGTGTSANASSEICLSESLLAFVLSRVSGLPSDLLLVAKVAACIGTSFDLRTLASIGSTMEGASTNGMDLALNRQASPHGAKSQWSMESLQARCQALELYGLLRCCNASASGGVSSRNCNVPSFGFVSEVVREGLYSTLPFAQRASLHSALADGLWSELLRAPSGSHQEGEAYANLGHHLACARKPAEAKACFERAAACAKGLSEEAWAERLLKQAAEHRTPAPSAAPTRR